MTGAQLTALLPLIALAVGAIAVMLAIAVRRHHDSAVAITLLASLVALGALVPATAVAPQQVTPLFLVDGYALVFTAMIAAATAVTALVARDYLAQLEVRREEFYLLLLLAAAGAVALTASVHLAAFFLALETTSVALFALIAYRRAPGDATEAGIKYLVLAGLATGILVFGLALMFAATGALSFAAIQDAVGAETTLDQVLAAATALVIVGVGFKLSLTPFHLWTPDVYQGAPSPVTGFLATVSKAAVFAAAIRLLLVAAPGVELVLSLIALAAMLAGNLLALQQDNLKRLLAYSSIAHMGYALVILIAGGAIAAEALAYYLAAYVPTTLGAFALIAARTREAREPETLEEWHGLFWRAPWQAAAMSVMMLSLAGIPLTAGFVAKFYALAAGVESARWMLVLVLVAGSAIGLYYYLRVIIAMAMPAHDGAPCPTLPAASRLAIGALTLVVITLGVYPQPLMAVLARVAVGFG